MFKIIIISLNLSKTSIDNSSKKI